MQDGLVPLSCIGPPPTTKINDQEWMSMASTEGPAQASVGVAGDVSASVPISVPIPPRWVDTATPGAYLSVCDARGSDTDITLLFGTPVAAQPGTGIDATAMVPSHHIVLTPYSAKRLAQTLAQGLREYEQRFGAIASN